MPTTDSQLYLLQFEGLRCSRDEPGFWENACPRGSGCACGQAWGRYAAL